VGSGVYTSTAKVVFLGSGADELLGGYSRHREAFVHRGWQGLAVEVDTYCPCDLCSCKRMWIAFGHGTLGETTASFPITPKNPGYLSCRWMW
jgi:hypothetical protein